MKCETILVPIDFSAPSREALRYAHEFARTVGARLILVHVIEPMASLDLAGGIPFPKEDDVAKRASQDELHRWVEEEEIEPSTLDRVVVRFGRAFHEIARAATLLRADLIILSTHGYTGLKHVFLGSTSERVVRHAPCAVLVLRGGPAGKGRGRSRS